MKLVVGVALAATVVVVGCSATGGAKSISAEEALRIVSRHNCLACHGVDKKIVGPSFKDVAARYRGQDAQQKLFAKVRGGGSGVWGPIPEPPNRLIPEQDLRAVLQWIVELAPHDVGMEVPAAVRSAGPGPRADCSVTVTQDGNVVPATVKGRVRILEMRSAPFRMAVSSLECRPSVGVFLKVNDFLYVAEQSFVVTTSGHAMAGNVESNDVLFVRSEDPRMSPEDSAMSAEAKRAYSVACANLPRCPAPLQATRTYWNFIGPGEQKRTFADFKRITRDKPIDGFRGELPVVVYTEVDRVPGSPGDFPLYTALETHPMVLKFR